MVCTGHVVISRLTTGTQPSSRQKVDIGESNAMVHQTDSTGTHIHDPAGHSPASRTMSLPCTCVTSASVRDTSDVLAGLMPLLNGKRTFYIPLTKLAGRSTITVLCYDVRQNIGRFQSLIPEDIQDHL